MSLRWEASLTGQEYRIVRDKVVAGILKVNIWDGAGYGELNGYMLRFKNKGFWSKKTRILDIEGTRELGTISYNYWKSTALVTYEEVEYSWQYQSIWRRKARLANGNQFVELFPTSYWKNEGIIENESLSPALVLTGLFIHSYFTRISAAS